MVKKAIPGAITFILSVALFFGQWWGQGAKLITSKNAHWLLGIAILLFPVSIFLTACYFWPQLKGFAKYKRRPKQPQYNLGNLLIEGKEVFDKFRAVGAQWSGNNEAAAIIYFEAWYNKVSDTLQRTEFNQYYPLWYKDAGGLDRFKSRIPDYIKACEAGLNRLEDTIKEPFND
ncbi:hypothetical protein ACFLU8_04080 [Chloroflexota bacterium]